ncbi:MAG: hypothetical protein OSA99_04000 [Acidimicrobiales bacterium]|nr:hypothetical protein [Acidimicrobiales bacterium]
MARESIGLRFVRYTQNEPPTQPFFSAHRVEWCAVLSALFVAPFLVLSVPVVIATDKPRPTVIAVVIVGAGASWAVGTVGILLLTWIRFLFGAADPNAERPDEPGFPTAQTLGPVRHRDSRTIDWAGGVCVLGGVALFVAGRSVHGGVVAAAVALTTVGLVIFFARGGGRPSQ